VKELSSRLAELRGSRRSHAAPDSLLGGKGSIRRRRGKLAFSSRQGRVEVRSAARSIPLRDRHLAETESTWRAKGSPFARSGRQVAHAGWFRGFGTSSSSTRRRHVSLMAHLDQLQKALGDSVRARRRVERWANRLAQGALPVFRAAGRQTPQIPRVASDAAAGARPCSRCKRRRGEMKRFSCSAHCATLAASSPCRSRSRRDPAALPEARRLQPTCSR